MFQESSYTQEQSIIASQAVQLSRKFTEQYFLAETKADRYPAEFWKAICDGGYLGLLSDPKFGGAGMSAPDLVVFLYNMAKEGLASYQLVNQLLCSHIVSRFGSEPQCAALLPSLIRGEFWCYADLEDTRGNSLFDIGTTARLEGDRYILNGNKRYAVCAQMASHLIVGARTAPRGENDSEEGLSLFLVDASSAGIAYQSRHINVRITPAREEMAATGDRFDSIQFANVEVPATNLIGTAGHANEQLKRIASLQLLLAGILGVGWGDRLMDKTIAYANERVIFKDAISSYQAVQHPMVIAKTAIEMAKLLIERAAEVFDELEDVESLLTYCSVAKARGTEAAYVTCDIAMQSHGGSGYDRDTGIVSLWPLILMSRLVPLNNTRILGRFAEEALGMPVGDEGPRESRPLLFESRAEREIQLIDTIKLAAADPERAAQSSEDATAFTGLMARLMTGDLAPFQDLILSDGQAALPVKLDIFRQYAVYVGADAAIGGGIPRSLVQRSPIKFGLSAMAMAAVSAGRDGRARVMNEYLPKMMQGKLFCYCITEPDAGTNTHNVSTIAVDEGDHYRLNGQKTFISAADTAYFMAVVARVEVNGKHDAVGTFVMEAKTPGISMTELDIAVLGDPQFTIHFDDVILPKDALVGTKSAKGDVQKGISEGVFYTLNLERIMVALGAMMIGRESLERAIHKAKEPQSSGPLAGASDEIKQKLAHLKLEQELTNLALKKAAVAFDTRAPGKQVGMYANMAKYISSNFAHDAADVALQIYGVEGMDKDLDDIGGLYQLGRVLRTVPINNEMVLNFLAENLLGLPKSYRT